MQRNRSISGEVLLSLMSAENVTEKLRPAAAPSRTPLYVLIATLVATNVTSAAIAIFYALRSATPPSELSNAVFVAQHATDATPASFGLVANISSPRMAREQISYSGTASHHVVAAGSTTIFDAAGVATYAVHLEVVNGSTLGEYATPSGRVGSKSLQLRFLKLADGEEAIVIPMSLSLVPGAQIVIQYMSVSIVSEGDGATLDAGRLVFQQGGVGEAEWDSFMEPALA